MYMCVAVQGGCVSKTFRLGLVRQLETNKPRSFKKESLLVNRFANEERTGGTFLFYLICVRGNIA